MTEKRNEFLKRLSNKAGVDETALTAMKEKEKIVVLHNARVALTVKTTI